VVQTLHLHFDESPFYFTAEALSTLREVFFHMPLRGRHVKRISALRGQKQQAINLATYLIIYSTIVRFLLAFRPLSGRQEKFFALLAPLR
jgi:hypothetical protein